MRPCVNSLRGVRMWVCPTAQTIDGLEFLTDPEVPDVPLVADFTSTLLSRPVNVSR
jgi:phosphoserine aminotransferase